MFCSSYIFPSLLLPLSSLTTGTAAKTPAAEVHVDVDLNWYPPKKTAVNDLDVVVNGTGVGVGVGVFGGGGGGAGFVFDSSQNPGGVEYDATYNYCNMPHVRREEYVVPASAPASEEEYRLEYVEVIHRHHKRTPYAANTFPRESFSWECDDEGLFYYGEPMNPPGNTSASTYWAVFTTDTNPFAPEGFNGTCQFPQITRMGLDDSFQHGADLYGVYHDLLHFLPDTPDPKKVSYRVTNNVITSQVAGMMVNAMYHPADTATPYPLKIQPDSIDSLEPSYSCDFRDELYEEYAVGGNNTNWTLHLTVSEPFYAFLDNLSGVETDDEGFHMSFDHYFDNLSSRQCHGKPLPCQIGNASNCVTQDDADHVYRLGQYEYSYIYRDAPQSLEYSVARYGVWIAELAQHLRDRIAGVDETMYRHNVAHDGSVSPLLSILQVDVMIWPGMGAEVVFELYSSSSSNKTESTAGNDFLVRVLWGGQVMRSSNPSLGVMDMLDVNVLLAYFDGLVGKGASKIPGICEG